MHMVSPWHYQDAGAEGIGDASLRPVQKPGQRLVDAHGLSQRAPAQSAL